MRILRIRYLILLSSVLVGCAAAYKDLQPADEGSGCDELTVSSYPKNWFTAAVDVQGHHLSGLLLIKRMPDGSDRVVFTNELGVSFFDFEFSESGFKVIQVINKLDVKAVLNTLKQDFELLLLKGAQAGTPKNYKTVDEVCYAYPWDGKVNYIFMNAACDLIRLERGSGKKKLVEISFEGKIQNPDIIRVQHFNFNMRIMLTKIDRDGIE